MCPNQRVKLPIPLTLRLAILPVVAKDIIFRLSPRFSPASFCRDASSALLQPRQPMNVVELMMVHKAGSLPFPCENTPNPALSLEERARYDTL